MYISKIHLEDFGKFTNNEISLGEGLNCVYGKNEDGKSTIKGFVSYIFSSLHQPYSYDKISAKYKRYKPFNSEEFKGHLLCDDLFEEKGNTHKIFQDFTCMTKPEVTDAKGAVIDVTKDKVNVIGFHELQGEKSKDLLVDILNRIEDLKNSNLYGIHAKDVFTNVDNISLEYKNEIDYSKVVEELREIEEVLSSYQSTYDSYKRYSKKMYHLKATIDELKSDIENHEFRAVNDSRNSLITLNNTITSINDKIKAYEEELEELEDYKKMDLAQAEGDLAKQKEFDSVAITIDEKKEEFVVLGQRAQKIAFGRDYKKIHKLTEAEDIALVRENVQKLKEQHEEVEHLKRTIDDFKELKSSTTQNKEALDKENEIAEIAKEYFKYVNISEWGKTIAVRLAELEDNRPDNKGEAALLSKKKQYKLFFIVIAVFIVVSSGAFVAANILPLIALPILGFIAIGVLGFLFVKNNDLIDKIHAEFKTYELELKRYEEMAIENKDKLSQIITRRECNDEEEFFEMYFSTKDIHANFEEFESKIVNLNKQLEKIEVGLSMTHKRINEMENTYSVELSHLLDKPNQLRSRLEEYILESKEYATIYDKRQKLQEEIAEMDSKSKLVSQKIEISAEEIEEKSQAYQLAKYELERLLRLKEENLKGLSEEQLEQFVANYSSDPEVEPILISKDAEELYALARDLKANLISKTETLSNIKLSLDKDEAYLYKAKKLKRKQFMLQHTMNEYLKSESIVQQTSTILRGSSADISTDITDHVEAKISNIIYKITNKYTNIRFTKEMELQFFEHKLNEWKAVDHLSVGTIDQIYISLRLAIVELTDGYNDYPLIFDDSFVQYDKRRLTRIIEYLAEMNRQVIILTCHKREKKVMENLNITHKYIQLS